MPEAAEKILVVKLGALGDFVQALGPMAAIRRHHASAVITLLTTAPYAELARATGFFDDIWLDERPGRFDFPGWISLRKRLRGGGFIRVYDLQTSDRSALYFKLFLPGPMPEWSGVAKGCTHPHANPLRDTMHTIERQAEQLAMAGIVDVPGPEATAGLTGLDANVSRFCLEERFALLVPGGAAHRPEKRWPAERFAALAGLLWAKGVRPVILGGPAETTLAAAIVTACSDARDLTGQTSLLDIAGLARLAGAAVGNDTGPMHLIAALDCPSVVLYSKASDPGLCGQRGANVGILRRDDLAQLSVPEVDAALNLA